ncbi:MAG TPA: hypothetical protein VF996_02005 [Candidatus Saccharimonadales bacterium]
MAQLKLPNSIATKSDLVGVIRNVDDVIDNYIENRVRDMEGVDFKSRPDVTSNLAELVAVNKLEVNVDTLKSLKEWLAHLNEHAPIVRFTFASDPNPEFIGGIVNWLRMASGRFVIIRYGIQPTIAAGCLMYTPAKMYDFSLRKRLMESDEVFLRALTNAVPPAEQAVADAPQEVPPQ